MIGELEIKGIRDILILIILGMINCISFFRSHFRNCLCNKLGGSKFKHEGFIFSVYRQGCFKFHDTKVDK